MKTYSYRHQEAQRDVRLLRGYTFERQGEEGRKTEQSASEEMEKHNLKNRHEKDFDQMKS